MISTGNPRFPLFLLCLLSLARPGLFAEPYTSPQGAFRADPPPGYELTRAPEGEQASFHHPRGAFFEIGLAQGRAEPTAYLEQILSQLNPGPRTGNQGGPEIEAFSYRGRGAALARLEFSMDNSGRPCPPGAGTAYQGWALCVDPGDEGLLALAYGIAGKADLELLALSCLDSVAPAGAPQYYFGPVTEFTWPRGEPRETPLYNTGIRAPIAAGDAEAAQGLVDREFQVLRQYERSPQWQEAWRRFYRMIWRDSWERLAGALFQLERAWNAETLSTDQALSGAGLSDQALAAKALAYVQGFHYERDLMGSDFVNLVSAITEGRGDCDSRALLWALFLAQANIPAGIMVSRDYSHAMGIADIQGAGARFPLADKQYLVAETTAKVELGLIGKNVSETAKWLGVVFE